MAFTPRKIDVSRDQLYQWYVVDKLSVLSILRQTDIKSERTIKSLLKGYGIPLRTRHEALHIQWQNPERKELAKKVANKNFSPFDHIHFAGLPEVKAKISAALSGEKNHNFLGGMHNWFEQGSRHLRGNKRKKAMNALGNKCKQCGATEKLTINHNPPWRICKSHDLKFLEILCMKCHYRRPMHER